MHTFSSLIECQAFADDFYRILTSTDGAISSMKTS